MFLAVENALKLMITKSVVEVKPGEAPYRSTAYNVFSGHGPYNYVSSVVTEQQTEAPQSDEDATAAYEARKSSDEEEADRMNTVPMTLREARTAEQYA